MTKRKPTSKQLLIYLGPTLKKPRLQAHTVFIDRVPDHLATDEIKHLVVPIEKMASIKAKLQDKSSLASHYFAKILETQKEV